MTENTQLQTPETIEYIDYAPPSDVIENHHGIKVLLDVPGASPDKLAVDVEDRILKIVADTDIIRDDRHVRYKRNFQISGEIELTKITAKVKDGILELILPKADSAKVHKVKIETGG